MKLIILKDQYQRKGRKVNHLKGKKQKRSFSFLRKFKTFIKIMIFVSHKT